MLPATDTSMGTFDGDQGAADTELLEEGGCECSDMSWAGGSGCRCAATGELMALPSDADRMRSEPDAIGIGTWPCGWCRLQKVRICSCVGEPDCIKVRVIVGEDCDEALS